MDFSRRWLGSSLGRHLFGRRLGGARDGKQHEEESGLDSFGEGQNSTGFANLNLS